jgi:hypothetical protein
MQLAALAIGVGVPADNFAGRVAEIHARAALIKLTAGGCITLLGRELGRQPRGVSLDLPENISLQQLLSANAECAKRGGIVRFSDGAFAIDLRGAPQWRSGIAALNFDCRSVTVARAYRTVRLALAHDGRSRELSHFAGSKRDELGQSIRTRDPSAAERVIGALVGLGEGKTPAGDDYLVGVFAALWSCSTTRAFAAALAPLLIASAGRTSDLSSLYLREAANGEASERLADVAAGICAGGSEEVVGNAVTKALAVGHSSGAAGIFGLLNGYAADAEAPFQATADSMLAPAF